MPAPRQPAAPALRNQLPRFLGAPPAYAKAARAFLRGKRPPRSPQ